ncbi:MAG: hypothetical protein QXL66_03395 [Thermoplasmata archaeon]
MNTIQKGNKIENKYLKYLESEGYKCFKALRVTRRTQYGFRNIRTDFFGLFDIIAINSTRTLLVQVESSRRHSIKKIADFAVKIHNSHIVYQLVRYHRKKREWYVYEISAYSDNYKITLTIETKIYSNNFKESKSGYTSEQTFFNPYAKSFSGVIENKDTDSK